MQEVALHTSERGDKFSSKTFAFLLRLCVKPSILTVTHFHCYVLPVSSMCRCFPCKALCSYRADIIIMSNMD
jgi:hypothetical protein